MMTLAQYLESENLTQADFAKLLGVTQATVSKLTGGSHRRFPSVETAKRIATVTGGRVPITAWPNLAAVVEAAQETRS